MPHKRERTPVRDVEALKVFTHPLRVRLLRLLYAGGPGTASELGRQLDVTPSLVSYHLRTMAKYGYIGEDPDGTGDGRERRWRVERDLLFYTSDFEDDEVGRETVDSVIRVLRAERTDRYGQFLQQARSMSKEWQDAAFSMAPTVRLSAGELQALGEEITEVIDRYRDRAAETEDGETREHVLIELLGFPFKP